MVSDGMGIGPDVVKVECETCGWYRCSDDPQWTLNAGTVHADLKPGHVVRQVTPSTGEREVFETRR